MTAMSPTSAAGRGRAVSSCVARRACCWWIQSASSTRYRLVPSRTSFFEKAGGEAGAPGMSSASGSAVAVVQGLCVGGGGGAGGGEAPTPPAPGAATRGDKTADHQRNQRSVEPRHAGGAQT